MHRAFHGYGKAISRVEDHQGNDVTALAGFLRMTTKMVNENNVSAIAFVMDPTGDQACKWRTDVFPEYKGGRSETDSQLKSQILRLPNMLAHLGLPLITITGAEADDAIADIVSALLLHSSLTAIISSGDKDLYQLLDPANQITLLRGAPTVTTWESVTAKHNVTPDRWSEYSALVGEGADNLPGISGIGPKKAIALINAYSDCADMFDAKNLEEVVGRAAAAKVRAGEMDYHTCKMLNELGTGKVIDLTQFKLSNIDTDALIAKAPSWLTPEARSLAAAISK
jgi:DNA polymerase-1|tara:strand:- start:430 stop:1278 length:849 start_codon:yes stop_codon:yes gene_type:complete